MNFNKKVVLITGCSSGIGEALSIAFHKKGHAVIATARDTKKIQHLKDMGMMTVQLDVTSDESVRNAVNAVKSINGGRLDMLVNNSGIGYAMPILDADISIAQKTMNTNFFGRVRVTQAFAPQLIESKGSIVNIGSIQSINPFPFASMYGATCAAVHQWNDVLRLEMEPFDVKVLHITVGAIKTEFLNKMPESQLPADSRYLPEKETIEGAMNGTLTGEFTNVNSFAERAVVSVTASSPKKDVWIGKFTTRLWLAHTFLWSTVWDYVFPQQFGLTALKNKIASGKL